MVNAKNQIAKLEAVRANLIAASKSKARETKPSGDNSLADSTLTGPAQQTQSQLQANQLEIGNRESAIASLKARINDYQGRLNASPGTGAGIGRCKSRLRTIHRQNYDDLLKKRKDDSEMATSM